MSTTRSSEVHAHAKQGADFGYTRVRGLNLLLATVSTAQALRTADSRSADAG